MAVETVDDLLTVGDARKVVARHGVEPRCMGNEDDAYVPMARALLRLEQRIDQMKGVLREVWSSALDGIAAELQDRALAIVGDWQTNEVLVPDPQSAWNQANQFLSEVIRREYSELRDRALGTWLGLSSGVSRNPRDVRRLVETLEALRLHYAACNPEMAQAADTCLRNLRAAGVSGQVAATGRVRSAVEYTG